MEQKYYIVRKESLPEVFEKVVYAKQLLIFKSVEKEDIWSDEDGNIFLSRECVDEGGIRCSLNFVQSPSNNILLLIDYTTYTICYGLIPD